MVPSQISSWVRFYWLPLGLTLPGPFFLFVALLCIHFWFSLSLNLDSDRSLPFIFHSSASSHLKCSDPGQNWFRTKLHFVFLLPLKMELQDGIHQCTTLLPTTTHRCHMLFQGSVDSTTTAYPAAATWWTGNGDCSSRKGKSAEIGQCDSEISRRGLSSSLDFNFSSTCPTLISSSPLSQTSRNKWKLSTYNKGKWKHPFSERQKSPFHCLCDAPSMPYNRVIQYSVLGGGASSHSLVAMVAGPF